MNKDELAKWLLFALALSVIVLPTTSWAVSNPTLDLFSGFEIGQFHQALDHKHPSGSPQFSQRYFVNSQFASSDPTVASPVFIYMCGEEDCAGQMNQLGTTLLYYAKEFHAHVVALEHRYYGASIPFSSLASENLKYLTIENALADVASLARSLKQEKRFQGKWISFGGSYPGSLSAWIRAAYPDVIDGAISSSGPVIPNLPSPWSIDAYLASRAGPECVSKIQEAFHSLQNIVDGKGSQKLSDLKLQFGGQAFTDEEFLGAISGLPAGLIQMGARSIVCSHLENAATSLEGLATLNKDVYGNTMPVGEKPMSSTAVNTDPTFQDQLTPEARPWMYQVCTQFPYYYSPNPDRSQSVLPEKFPVYKGLSGVAAYQALCRDVYGLKSIGNGKTIAKLYRLIQNPRTSRILFVLGEDDPWTSMSIAEMNGNLKNPGLSSFVMKDAGHCADLEAPSDTNLESVKLAHEMIEATVAEWLWF